MEKKYGNIHLEVLTEQEAQKLWHLPVSTKHNRIREQHQRRRMVQRATAAALRWNAPYTVSVAV